MAIRVLFFGATAELVGHREIKTDIDGWASRLLDKIVADYPQLGSQKLLISVNQEHASGETVVRDGDEIAIFTPVSGG